ncbi:SDR family oxidoreductase [Halobacteriovorax vibrionivorans]|uniref:SDR family oxidoreductase n=1 Tax=Halobacteriovorax vibrionivorans TaxID=2152716 RepID=A0ABY0IF11_9BACT|nr:MULTISPECIES: SDR family NAD(P)-dependent oxidoreductase [Halobacteriovorax]RZF20401.1 SDR family oxidoreductase [Halobacteriovorax vibrionivorans]TGD46574.1 SDR family oxidoreductase [Halobacteriovorax sp. Y22]
MFDFNDQVAIVTGGTRGIGRGITESFLKSGARVVATYAGNHDAANAFKAELGELGENLYLEAFDVSDASAVEEFWNRMNEQFEQIHILVNNSGIRKDNLSPIMPDEDWARVLDINLTGTFLMTKRAVNHFLSKRYGRIINMSSVGGSLGLPGQANYAASKAGQVAMSKSISKEVGKRGITINNVCPGFIETELIADLPAEQVKEYKKQVPLKRFGKVEEVAHAVQFLASKEAAYITGASLEVTGGL